jgi:hypothetical protein
MRLARRPRRANDWAKQTMLRFAITLQIVHLVYNQVATLFDLFPFNGVRAYSRRERFTEAGVNGAIMVLPAIGYLSRVPFLMEAGLLCLVVLLLGEIATWWIPYFFGGSPKWVAIYSRVHSQTLTPLPRRGPNPVPNWEHLILMGLTLLTTIVSFAAYRATNGLSFPYWWILAPLGAILVSGVVVQCCVTPKEPSQRAATPQARP